MQKVERTEVEVMIFVVFFFFFSLGTWQFPKRNYQWWSWKSLQGVQGHHQWGTVHLTQLKQRETNIQCYDCSVRSLDTLGVALLRSYFILGPTKANIIERRQQNHTTPLTEIWHVAFYFSHLHKYYTIGTLTHKSKEDRPGECMPEKDCFWWHWLKFRQHEWKTSSELWIVNVKSLGSFTWLVGKLTMLSVVCLTDIKHGPWTWPLRTPYL